MKIYKGKALTILRGAQDGDNGFDSTHINQVFVQFASGARTCISRAAIYDNYTYDGKTGAIILRDATTADANWKDKQKDQVWIRQADGTERIALRTDMVADDVPPAQVPPAPAPQGASTQPVNPPSPTAANPRPGLEPNLASGHSPEFVPVGTQNMNPGPNPGQNHGPNPNQDPNRNPNPNRDPNQNPGPNQPNQNPGVVGAKPVV